MTISRTLLTDEVVSVLRDRIYRGVYPQGTRLRQEPLADELGVSRTPLREAFRTLASEGLLQILPSRGARVVAPDMGRVLAAFEVREVLDGLGARRAARRGDDEFVRILEDTLCRQREAVDQNDLPMYTNENVRFHECVWRAAGNEFLLAHLHIIRMTAQLLVPVKVLPTSISGQAINEHRKILDMIVAGDATGAEWAARAHIRHTTETISKWHPSSNDGAVPTRN